MSQADPIDFPVSTPSIWRHQTHVYEKLHALARLCFGVQRSTLPVKLRTNSLLIGPTGVGKSHLVGKIATEHDAEFFCITLSNWIILGGRDRSSQTTWVAILEFLRRHHNRPVILFVDELEKAISLRHQDTWSCHLRTEVFQLLDRKIPRDLKDADGNVIGPSVVAAAQDRLENHTFIVASATFQDIWERSSKSPIGFQGEIAESPALTPDLLARELPREIVNRFRHEYLILPELKHADYVAMLELTSNRVPPYLRQKFLQLGYEKIPAAISMRQGCRFIEDLMTDVLLTERASIQLSDLDPGIN